MCYSDVTENYERKVLPMKRTINLPSYRIEEFTSPMVNGQSLVVYHLYIDGNYTGTFTTKEGLLNNLNDRLKCAMGVY